MTDQVWFHAHGKIIGFIASTGEEIPTLLASDNYRMPLEDARRLEVAGAGHIRGVPIMDVARFKRASDLYPLTDGMERETDAINKLDRGDENDS